MINFPFIYKLEGGLVTRAYVPAEVGSDKSGITIGAGFDLGQYTKDYINALDIDDDLRDKILSYVGLRGNVARNYLSAHPLYLSSDEIETLMGVWTTKFHDNLARIYGENSDVSFDDIPDAAQTVIASVAWQYGNITTKCPQFWEAATSQDWVKMVDILKDFEDDFPTRRKIEAKYFEDNNNGEKS